MSWEPHWSYWRIVLACWLLALALIALITWLLTSTGRAAPDQHRPAAQPGGRGALERGR